MIKQSKLSEKVVQYIWKKQFLRPEELRLTNGFPITVANIGKLNENEGPDFLNGEVIFDGDVTATGDIEIHLNATDWLLHEHQKNPAYNNVVLHVVMWDDGYHPEIRKENGKFLPTLILSDFLDRPIGKLVQTIRRELYQEDFDKLPCQKNLNQLNLERLERAGQHRFLDKASHFQNIADKFGWEQALYQGLMMAMGYSKNKWQFVELSQKVCIEKLKNLGEKKIIQAALLGMAGLLPHQTQRKVNIDQSTQSYVKLLESAWKDVKYDFAGTPMSDRQWIFAGQRPSNFPLTRIGQAGILFFRFLNAGLFQTFYKILTNSLMEGNPLKELYKQLSLLFIAGSDDYWTTHYTFWGKLHLPVKNIVGKQRQRVIVLNILFPLFYAYAQRMEQKVLREAIWDTYNTHPPLGENRITKYQTNILKLESNMMKRACLEQGLIYVYRDTCFQKKCEACILGSIIR